jgi:hypothetical protein
LSFYLQVAIGASRYLLDAAHALELRQQASGFDRVVDLREVFGEDGATRGRYVVCAQASGDAVVLIVDAVEELVHLDDAEFCALPPLGPLGPLFDAISTRVAEGRPMLRLRGERVQGVVSSPPSGGP